MSDIIRRTHTLNVEYTVNPFTWKGNSVSSNQRYDESLGYPVDTADPQRTALKIQHVDENTFRFFDSDGNGHEVNMQEHFARIDQLFGKLEKIQAPTHPDKSGFDQWHLGTGNDCPDNFIIGQQGEYGFKIRAMLFRRTGTSGDRQQRLLFSLWKEQSAAPSSFRFGKRTR